MLLNLTLILIHGDICTFRLLPL